MLLLFFGSEIILMKQKTLHNYRTLLSFLALFLLTLACQNSTKKSTATLPEGEKISIRHAKGFSLTSYGDYKIIEVYNPWPEAEKVYRYALVQKGKKLPKEVLVDVTIAVPVERIIVTSTTHIPSLEMLEEEDKIIAFPNLDYISSEKTRTQITNGNIREIGNNQSINTEIVIDLAPDLFVGFGIDGNNKSFHSLEKAGIPIVYNGDWTEISPLGKAEWIKFFGAFFNKETLAENEFSKIETEYLHIKELAQNQTNSPTVLSGAMWKDIWYLPQGNSWAAQFIKDANGSYLWADSNGIGSLSLNIESVLEKAQNASFWIGPGQFDSLQRMQEAHHSYSQFEAFNTGEIYSFSQKKGATGGVIYYELAPNRPDIVLKDLVKILHPELLPEHELFFFTKIK